MEGTPTTDSKWMAMLRTVFGIDPRSLAVFRVMVGVIIVVDQLVRWSGLEAFTTDQGLLDRETAMAALRADYGSTADVVWSLNYLSGDLWFQQLLSIVLMVAAVCLSLGLFTRLATIFCWALIVSLHMRCPIILSSGDTLLRTLLFWSIFAPLGHCWSLDARLARRELPELPQKLLSGGTAGLISQMIIMYFFAGIAKWNDVWWQGEAMDYVLRLDIYARPWAAHMLQQPLMLKLVTWSTLFAEVFLILLMLLPWRNSWWRSLNLVIYVALHLAIASTMNIGLFSYISIIGWLPILPAAFWNSRLWNRWVWEPPYGDPYSDPAPDIVVSGINQRQWLGGLRLIGNVFASGMIVYVLLWNLANIPSSYDGDLKVRLNLTDEDYDSLVRSRRSFALALPANLRWLGVVTGTAQHFQMFGVPPLISPWFVYDATLEDGTRIDLLRLKPVSYERPESTLSSIPGHHWRKLHRNCLTDPLAPIRSKIADYLVRRWNSNHRTGKQISSLRVTCYLQKTGPQYQEEDVKTMVWYDTTRDVRSLDDLERLLNSNPNLLPGL